MHWLLPGASGLLFVAFFVTQLVWVTVILLGGLIGAIIYLAVGRPPGGATAARQGLPAGAPPPPPPPGGVL